MNHVFKYAIRHGTLQQCSDIDRKKVDSKSDWDGKTFMKLVAKAGFRKVSPGSSSQTAEREREFQPEIGTLISTRLLQEDLRAIGAKTVSSNRLISLDQTTQNILKNWRNTRYILKMNSKNRALYQKFAWNFERQLRPIKIHGFRHTHASLCFEAGATINKSTSDLKTTMNVYTHITLNEGRYRNVLQKFINF